MMAMKKDAKMTTRDPMIPALATIQPALMYMIILNKLSIIDVKTPFHVPNSRRLSFRKKLSLSQNICWSLLASFVYELCFSFSVWNISSFLRSRSAVIISIQIDHPKKTLNLNLYFPITWSYIFLLVYLIKFLSKFKVKFICLFIFC